MIQHLSNKTMNYFKNLSDIKRKNKKSAYDSTSSENIQKDILKMRQARIEKYDEIYSENSDRNKK